MGIQLKSSAETLKQQQLVSSGRLVSDSRGTRRADSDHGRFPAEGEV